MTNEALLYVCLRSDNLVNIDPAVKSVKVLKDNVSLRATNMCTPKIVNDVEFSADYSQRRLYYSPKPFQRHP